MYTLLKSILIVALGATLSLAEESSSSELNITLPLDPPNCKGQIIKRGVDTNHNGLLDESEITSTVEQYDEGTPITIEGLRSMIISKDENISFVNTCKITDMSNLFYFNREFSLDISRWNVGSVTTMRGMFWGSKFNRDIGYWDVSSVTDMYSMFRDSDFNQNIGAWDISNISNMRFLFLNSKISSYNYSRLLEGWSSLNLQKNLSLHMGRSRYSPNFKKYKDEIVDKFGWNIIDGGEDKYDNANYEDTPIDCTKILSFDKHLNFGEVSVGTFSTRELTLYNRGNCPLSITNLRVHESIEGIFLGSWKGEIAPNSSQAIPIVFFPKKEKKYSGLIYVDSDKTNGGDSNRLLQGRGISATDELMTISSLSPSNCKGRLLKKGEDKNHNGILDDSEVIYTLEQYDEGTPISITTLREMIAQKKDLTNINSCKITDMNHLFYQNRDFTQDISRWNVGSVRDMSHMFENTRFDPNISSWDTSNVVNMGAMFRNSLFNRDISSWDLSSVINMEEMFSSFSLFTQDISGWDVSHVVNMRDMFRANTQFNQDIDDWDLSSVQDISGMFQESGFDKDISSWDISNVRDMSRLFRSSKLSTKNYNAMLELWSNQELKKGLTLDMGESMYSSDFQIYRDILVNEFEWKIIDGGVKGSSSEKNCTKILTFDKHLDFGEVAVGSDTTKELILYNKGSCDLTIDQLRVHESIEGVFIGGWSGRIAPNSSKSIPITFVPTKEGLTNGLIYVYSNRTNGGDSSRLLSGIGVERKEGDSLTHIESLPHANCKGYLIKRGIDRDDNGVLDEGEITSSVEQYTKRTPVTIERLREMIKNGEDLTLVNTCKITDMSHLFEKSRFNQDISLWNVGSVTNMEAMFKESIFNRDINRWDTSNVTNMSYMFKNSLFNQKIGDWNTSSVTTMRGMFSNYSNFNQNIDSWDVSNITDMSAMFEYNFVFNQDLGSWDVSHVTSMKWMFANTPFNQDISSWDTSSVTTMRGLFSEDRIFNQDLSSWDISNVTDIAWMFIVTRFDHDISSWDISSVKDVTEMFEGVTLSTEHYDAILNGWSSQTELRDAIFDVGWSRYSDASKEARDRLINELGWRIRDGGFRR